MISKDYKELVLDLSSSITLMSGGLLIKLNYDLSTNMKGKNCNCAQKDSRHVFTCRYIYYRVAHFYLVNCQNSSDLQILNSFEKLRSFCMEVTKIVIF